MKKIITLTAISTMSVFAHVLPDPPVVRVIDLRADEKPIAVEKIESTVEENSFFRRVRATFVFTNPNVRQMQGEFEFPIPDGAFVCGYQLEVNGEMVPGVVCEKEKARVAFENETRKGVDPGLVEQVTRNLWRTRIFPLVSKTPRRAIVEYVVEKDGAAGAGGDEVIYERDGDDIFVARVCSAEARQSRAEKIAAFTKGVILWDASLSRLDQVAADRALIANLPETGEWRLVTFSNEPDAPRSFTKRDDLLTAIDGVIYDGGTDLAGALKAYGEGALVFSDELEPELVARPIEVRKATPDEKLPRLAPKPSTLLATVWAARRMTDLAAQAADRKDEFLALGRKYGVAGPGLSLIVLETLDQYLTNKIEPAEHLAIHAEWVKRRAAEDDQIAAKREQADFEKRLLEYWEERVKWWNDPKPKRVTPKSGLFDEGVTDGVAMQGAVRNRASAPNRVRENRVVYSLAAPSEEAVDMEVNGDISCGAALMAEPAPSTAEGEDSSEAARVTLKAWDPKTPYIDALKVAEKGAAYAVYLKERAAYKESPAFYLDCADFFFKAGEQKLGRRIISNLTEFKLGNVALIRTMGWRLRQAGAYEDAIGAFRKALELRGEEGQSWRDLGLILREGGQYDEAAACLHKAAFTNFARRSTRRGNDFQVAIIALEELNGLLAWGAANQVEIKCPPIDPAYRRDLPVKLRIVLAWDADETDIDLHVLEPNGEEAFYGHRRTAEGGFVSEDVTTGYGPEEYLKKDLEPGRYKVLTNYFASHQTTLTGATTVQATVYTDWGTAKEARQILTLRLDKPKDKVLIGEVML